MRINGGIAVTLLLNGGVFVSFISSSVEPLSMQ